MTHNHWNLQSDESIKEVIVYSCGDNVRVLKVVAFELMIESKFSMISSVFAQARVKDMFYKKR